MLARQRISSHRTFEIEFNRLAVVALNTPPLFILLTQIGDGGRRTPGSAMPIPVQCFLKTARAAADWLICHGDAVLGMWLSRVGKSAEDSGLPGVLWLEVVECHGVEQCLILRPFCRKRQAGLVHCLLFMVRVRV